MLNHVLRNRCGMRVAVIVNDMSEVNIDAALVRSGDTNLSRTEEQMVEMTNGCICCTLREDLLLEVRRLAEEGRFDFQKASQAPGWVQEMMGIHTPETKAHTGEAP
ncbi:hypothetical protein M911_04920 [Ectothiorhodospira haloalkaliphila]|uniref:CobW/HypB/UreG nucleotide-binding domain-containing protein n=1 Tax=Ectothiorhodospira haloalkaliphila TaxID=421628 RepID=W8KUF5_9GAMM|nr:hypothetical protein M911_04920 [Ectothiorhodospira haloalkaliphila]